jgi:hypothetical protein
VTDVLEDPFATSTDIAGASLAANRRKIITAGRYRLPNIDGSPKKGGWQRVTNLVKAITDQFSLRVWEIQQIMVAIHLAEERVMKDLRMTVAACEGQDYPTRRAEIEAFLDRCKDISGGNEGSKFGNARHELVEADHLQTPAAAPDSYARQHLSLFRSALVRNGLERVPGFAERRVLIEEFEAVGTLDAILLDLRKKSMHIGDLKTQKSFWTWLEIAAQLACYARAVAIWEPATGDDPRAGRWVNMPPVDRSIGFVLWMPRCPKRPEDAVGWEPHVDVYEVDIEAGWKTAQLAREVVLDRRGGKSVRNPRAWLREVAPVTETEKYAARFAAVSTTEEGAALVAECRQKGLWSPILAGEAKVAAERMKNGG